MDESTRRSYADWYVWALQNVSPDPQRALAASAAAIEVLKAGGAPAQATAAGLAAAPAAEPPTPGSERFRDDSYARWYGWARTTLTPDPLAAHRAAAAAVQALESGAPNEAAAAAARGVLGQQAVPPPYGGAQTWTGTGSALATSGLAYQFGGGILVAILFGIGGIIVPLVSRYYFPLLPIIGIISAVRGIRSGRLMGGIIAIVVNLVAGVVVLLASGLLGR